MVSPNDDHPAVFDCDEEGAGVTPVPPSGVIRLLSPAPTLYVALRHARLVEAWDARFAQELEPRRAVLQGDAASERLERELACAISLRGQAFDAQATRTVQVAQLMGKLLTASADLAGHRRVLAGLQRALHAARRPWHLRDAVHAELAPWRARLLAWEELLIGQFVENFPFLHGQIELRADYGEDGILFVDVAYAMPDATLPAPDAASKPWLVLGFVAALRGKNARPHLVREIVEIVDRSHVGEAGHG